jgi:hypothetical protein
MSKLQRGGGQFIKARYVQSCSTKAKPPWTINIHLIIIKKRRTDRRKKKQIFSGGGYQWERIGHKERGNEDEYGA